MSRSSNGGHAGNGAIQIGFDGRWYNRSGVGNFTLGLLNALCKLQHRFRLLLFEHPWNPVPIEAGGLQRVALKHDRYSIAGQLELSRRLGEYKIDLAHCPFYVAPFLARCPVVVTFYDLIAFRFPLYNPLKQAIVKVGYKASTYKAAGILVCSHRTASDCTKILGANPARIGVIYAGRSPGFTSDIEPGEVEYLERKFGVRPPYVLLLGSKHWRTKGLGFALRALAECRKSRNFQIAWAGAEDALFEDLDARTAGISDIVKCGFVMNPDLAKLYRHADAFVLPSLYEGFGMPLLEAMSCGCPVVCSNGGSLPEVAGNGAVVVPHDLDNMSKAVNCFLAHEGLRKEQKKRALARAAEFSWDRAASVVLGLYEQILGLRPGALSCDGMPEERTAPGKIAGDLAAVRE